MTKILEGKPAADAVLERVRERAKRLPAPPKLVVFLVGDDAASATYVRNKEKKCEELGFHSETKLFAADVSEATLRAALERCNHDPSVHGILLQLPIPAHLPRRSLLNAIDPRKDVDGLHPWNVGQLALGERGLVPCTPAGVVALLKHYQIPLAGKHAVIVGRSEIVGKPQAQLLLAEDMTVTIAHSRTKDLPSVTKLADLLIVAAGKPRLVNQTHVRPGAVVIDVGIHRVDGKLVGDVDAVSLEGIAAAVTPVPKGVGPMTIAQLLSNLVDAAELQRIQP